MDIISSGVRHKIAMAFIHDSFLLQTESARRLYHNWAAAEPILDYHCHLPPKDVAENRRFANLFEIWLEGDHYKWRAMRANGIDERFVTGDASPWEKFLAYARTVPATLRNPLYHWTHLELKRYFGIDELLNENTAQSTWNRANEQLAGELDAHGILRKFQVRAICTTDDPVDSLEYHRRIAASALPTRVYPTFRPDKALNVHLPYAFKSWLGLLEQSANMSVNSLNALLDALDHRHEFFHQLGGRLSDHGLSACPSQFATHAEASAIFDRARAGNAASPEEFHRFAGFMMLFFGQLDAKRNWTKQLHLGARRNNNSRRFGVLGPDTGYDSIGDWLQGDGLGAYLDALEKESALPRMVLYNLNPADNYLFATMAGNFQDGRTVGKIQFGSGWWFLDQKEAMEWQMNALSNAGLVSRFVGMLTDSRSFMSYPRHEYFRRTLCNLLGQDMEDGLLPNDEQMIGSMVKNICFGNAAGFFGLKLD